ncbi:hypothetical protein [Rubinisphaera italica]|uniref:ATP synthase I chain n=1 Tax=Rubinisphaera italica TaxID=2527969 RepID=A0A5C5XJP5_9PLAN|nr:hypothetical protein [Rubinisphaera italica]TWT63054.1 hypothetical protein Pan54_38050 [Rubinisphaera italica]
MREALTLTIWLVLLLGCVGVAWRQAFGEAATGPYALAAGVCIGFGVTALLVQESCFRMGADFVGSLGSILIRTMGPLLTVAVISKFLHEPQIFPAFVCCYLLTLLSETILSVRLVNRWDKRRAERSSAKSAK